MTQKKAAAALATGAVFFFFSIWIQGRQAKEESLTIIHGPYIQNVTENSATIIWFTNKNCVSKIEYGRGENFRTFPQWGSLLQTSVRSRHGLIDAFTACHRVTITGLEPGGQYPYRVVSKEIVQFQPYEILYGDTVVSEIFSFRTLDRGAESITFCVVNDIHENTDRLDTLLQNVDWENTDVVFLNGDTLSHIEEEDQIFNGFLDKCVERFATRIPFVFVRGNHETRGKYARHLEEYLSNPGNRFYFSFNHGPVHFVVLDSGEDKEDSHPVYAGLADFDFYRSQQAAWLKKDFQGEKFKESAFTVVFCHIPPFGGNEWYGEQAIRKAWAPLLNEGDIDLLICAHTHRFKKMDPVEGIHSYPILIGGTDTIITIDADRERLEVEVSDLQGQIRESFALLPRASR